MTSKIILYRVTNPGDGKTVADRIDFNDATATQKDTKIENAYITRFQIKDTEGVGDNQSSEQELGDLQALGPIENKIILHGHISNRIGDAQDGQNAFISTMNNWDTEAKQNSDFEEGRFGIEFGDMRQYDVIPVGTGSSRVGMILESIEWDCDWEKNPARAGFIMTFRVSKGDGT